MRANCDYWIDRNYKLLVFVVVYLAFFLDNVLLTVVVPIIPDYLFSNDLNISRYNDPSTHFGPASLSPLQRKYATLEDDNGPLGALLASKAFVQLVFTPLVGYLIGILGCHIPLLLGSCNMLFASLLFAYGNSYTILVLARALHGSSSAAVAVSGMCILAKNVPMEMRPRLMPIAFGGIALGVLIGYPLGGAAYQLLGKSAPFLLVAVLVGLIIVLQTYILFSEEVDDTKEESVDYMESLSLLKSQNTLLITGAIFISTTSMAVLEPCVPMWLLANIDPPPSRWQLGAVFIPDSIGYFLGSHFAGLLSVKSWRMALSALVIVGLSCCWLPLATTIPQLSLPHFGVGLGVGIVDAALIPLLANLVDSIGSKQYGPVYALQQISVSLAYLLGPLIGGQAVHMMGFPWLIRIVGFLNIAYCPVLLMLENPYAHAHPKKEVHPALLGGSRLPSYSSLENSYSIITEE